ncbi:MAG: MFS transporter [Actinobacteria bacterium]|uniref:Unannotated protein n=1 Tax=freshwater metagenome TaxID=449393 RepID=A0A6J7F3W8_9ZZZZ|nr:MFS transporter [Actinomycetota bacterium]
MNSPGSAAKRRTFVDLTPLRLSPAFARLWFSALLTGLGIQVTIVAVGLQLYAITHDTLAVALVGGVALIPATIAAPLAGMMADAFDRRKLLIVLAIMLFSSTMGLLVLTVVDVSLDAAGGHVWIWPYYVFTTLGAMSGIAIGATRSAIVPRILPRELVAPASALNGLSMGAQVMVGPAIAGVLAATVGFEWTFVIDLVLSAAAFLGIALLPALPPLSDVVRPGWKSLKQSIRFLRGVPQITSGFVADILAMTFGRPYVLLPAVAAGLIGGGPITVGLIMSAGAAGTFLTGLFSGPVKHVRRQGLVIGRAIQFYGLFVVLFGLVLLLVSLDVLPRGGLAFDSVSIVPLVLGCLAFVGMGASDEVSAIFRTSMLLTDVPDEIRGRMQGFFFAVVNGGPRLGDVYAGTFAGLVTLWFPPFAGGFVIVIAMGLILRLTPALRTYVFDGAVPR